MTITSELMSDMISPELLDDFQQLNEEQRKIVIYDNGPVMVIAGPGSGKTRCLTLRAMNLLLLKKALPQELYSAHILKKRLSRCRIASP